MKIRNGFVSNSSSSSYIVNIKNISMSKFCDILAPEYHWGDLFSLGHAKESLTKWSKTHEKDAANADRWSIDAKKAYDDMLDDLSKVDKDNFEEVVGFMLKFRQIECKEVDGGIELFYFTSMHNDFVEGVSDALKEILLYFMFDTDYKVECKRESDNDRY